MLKAVLFDMDGVLVDSEILHCKAAVEAFHQLGIPVDFKYCFKFVGTTSKKMMDIVIEEQNLSYTNQELLDAFQQAKIRLLSTDGYDRIPYTRELLEDLYSKGYLLAIASSSTIEDIQYVVNTLDIKKYFHHIISGSNLPNPKPAPDIYLLAASKLGVTPNECIVIEDSSHGVNAGKSANMPVVGFINKNSGNQDLSNADILIEGFEEIDSYFLTNVYNRYHGIPFVIHEDDTMLIREFVDSDLPTLYSMLQELSTSNSYYENELIQDNLTLEQFIEKQQSYIRTVYPYYGYGLWGVFEKGYGHKRLIGRCGIQATSLDNQDIFELGYEISPKFANKGYGQKACTHIIDYGFNHLYMDRIYCKIDKKNIPSQALASRLGMKKEYDFKDQFIYSISKN